MTIFKNTEESRQATDATVQHGAERWILHAGEARMQTHVHYLILIVGNYSRECFVARKECKGNSLLQFHGNP
jgi:hypothetical protein